MIKQRYAFGKPAQIGAELGVLLCFATALSVVTYRAFPAWDDGNIVLMAQQGTQGAIYANHADRPVAGAIWQFLNDQGVLVPGGLLLHWLSWFATGWCTLQFWRLLFPNHGRFALVPACLAMAPITCRTQFVLLNPILGGQFGAMLAFLAVLLLWAPRRTTLGTVAVHVTAALMVSLAVLLSEYGVAATLAGTTLLVGEGFIQTKRIDRCRAIAAGLLILTAVVGYLVYHGLADPSSRSDIRPEINLPLELGWRAKWIPVRAMTLLWQATLGGTFGRLGDIRVYSLQSAASLAVGVVLAMLVAAIVRHETPQTDDQSPTDFQNRRRVMLLGGAILMGLVPVATMGRAITPDPFNSRYLLPVLPLAACFTVGMLLWLARPDTWYMVTVTCGFAAGYFVAADAQSNLASYQLAARWGAELESLVPNAPTGITVAVFASDGFDQSNIPRDGELTVRLAARWPKEKRDHFYASVEWHDGWPWEDTPQADDISRILDRLKHFARGRQRPVRAGPVDQILWIHVRNDGTLHINQSKSLDHQ